MIIKSKENGKTIQIDIMDGVLYMEVDKNIIFKIKLTKEQEEEIIKQTQNDNNFEHLLEIIDIPF